ncbi:uncharacterized mitochondrial protein AtMg00310-like [Rutidosis leptorrhynchoides]|uniref:uncharacterized mitochondrial protein AtMg00310-like n=1 Tax=Rutidosis leptorrhynchoides TaxID=125765 RepID=UPI003A990B35
MSFGGCLNLVNPVLNSLPLYYFSLFRAPSTVLKKLESVRRNFFWGGAGDESKISWVKWDDVIRPLADDGLNVGSIFVKNFAFIGKWWWRFYTEPTSLWVSVIKSIYGVSGSLNLGGNTSLAYSNTIWSNIIKTGDDINLLGIDFSKSISRSIGNGNNTHFWEDSWLLDVPLREKFKILVRLETNHNALVSDRIVRDGDGNRFVWNWSEGLAVVR